MLTPPLVTMASTSPARASITARTAAGSSSTVASRRGMPPQAATAAASMKEFDS
jgi:hypothetical protein